MSRTLVDVVRDRAYRAYVEAERRTWVSTGGVPYYKTATQVQTDRTIAKVLVSLLEDVGYLREQSGNTIVKIDNELRDRAIANGDLVMHPSKGLMHRADAEWIDRDDVPVRGIR